MDDGLLPDEGIKERVRVRGDKAATPVHTQTHCLGLQSSIVNKGNLDKGSRKNYSYSNPANEAFFGKTFFRASKKVLFFLVARPLPGQLKEKDFFVVSRINCYNIAKS